MECKKIAILGVFAECHGQGTRQRFFKKKILCRVHKQGHSAKKLLKKNKKNFVECLGRGTWQSNFFKKIKKKLCLVPGQGHSAKYLFKKK